MNPDKIRSIIEGVLFASENPVTLDTLAQIVDEIDKKDLSVLLDNLVAEWRGLNRGFHIVEVAGGWQFRTRPEYAAWVHRLRAERPSKLSRAALETLAMIAYKQPITRPEVEDLRGVDSGAVIKNLLERNLIKIIGRKDAPGKPVVYGTTERFLEVFSLRDLGSLPSLRDLKELEDGEGEQLPLPAEDAEGEPAQPLEGEDRRRQVRESVRGLLSAVPVKPDEPLTAADTEALPPAEDDEEDVLSELEEALARRKSVMERTQTMLDDAEAGYLEKIKNQEVEDDAPVEDAPAAEVSDDVPDAAPDAEKEEDPEPETEGA